MRPESKVFSFEPYPGSLALMQENLRMNGIVNVEVFAEAIGSESGELLLDLTSGEPLQFQSHLERTVSSNGSLSVRSLSLGDALPKLGLESCDLLKLDCEGAEYPILFGAAPSVLEHIQRIVMEYHDNLDQYHHNDLVRFLSRQGFQVEAFPNPVHSHLGYLRAIRKN
jgi:FkbM family methyltransferase